MNKDFENWLIYEKEQWVSEDARYTVVSIENGYRVTEGNSAERVILWNEGLYSSIKEAFKDCEFLYCHTHDDPEVGFSYLIHFKWKEKIFRYGISKYNGTGKFMRIFVLLDEDFFFLTHNPEEMEFQNESEMIELLKMLKKAERHIFNLPENRLRILLNQIPVEECRFEQYVEKQLQ